MLDTVNVNISQTRKPMAHEPGGRVGLFEFIGDGSVKVAQVVESADADRLPGAAVHESDRVGSSRLASFGFSPNDPRISMDGEEHEVVWLLCRDDFAQGVGRLRPHHHHAIDGVTILHLRTGKVDRAELPIDRGAGQIGAVLGSVPAVERQQDHRPKLASAGGKHAPGGFDGDGACLAGGHPLSEHRAVAGSSVNPVVIRRVLEDRPNALDGAGEGMAAKSLRKPPVHPGEVVGNKVVNQSIASQMLSHADGGILVVLQGAHAELPGLVVVLPLIDVLVDEFSDSHVSEFLGGRGGLVVINGAGAPVKLSKGFVRINGGDVELVTLVLLSPASANMRGEWERIVRLDGLHGCAFWLYILANASIPRQNAAMSNGFISPRSLVRFQSLLFQENKGVTNESGISKHPDLSHTQHGGNGHETQPAVVQSCAPGEMWLPLPSPHSKYEVSNHGRLRNALTRHIRKPVVGYGGYLRATLGHTVKVHRLVAVAFLGAPPTPSHQVNHKDGDKGNNHVGNLEWITRAGNMQHAVDTGLIPTGEAAGRGLTWEKVDQIKAMRAAGESWRTISTKFDVCVSSVRKVCTGKTWQHRVPRPTSTRHRDWARGRVAELSKNFGQTDEPISAFPAIVRAGNLSAALPLPRLLEGRAAK